MPPLSVKRTCCLALCHLCTDPRRSTNFGRVPENLITPCLQHSAPGSLWAVWFWATSLPTRLWFRRQLMWTLFNKKRPFFRGLLYREQPSEPFRRGACWISSAWTVFRHRLVVCRSGQKENICWYVGLVCCDGHTSTFMGGGGTRYSAQ